MYELFIKKQAATTDYFQISYTYRGKFSLLYLFFLEEYSFKRKPEKLVITFVNNKL